MAGSENMNMSIIADAKLRRTIASYMEQEFRPEALEAVQSLLSSKQSYQTNEDELRKVFDSRLQFGTAGLRGPMGLYGYNVMNSLTVLQTSQGVAHYLANEAESQDRSTKDVHVVIGYDGRHNSKEFAEFAAAAMLVKGFKCSLFGASQSSKSTVTPTPFTPYFLVRSGADFGIQVTASHNPKEDNGYKVYARNGAQIIPPTDEYITKLIQLPENLMKWEGIDSIKCDGQPMKDHPNLFDPFPEVMANYFDEVASKILSSSPKICESLHVVYTAMHGVGSDAVQQIAHTAGFPKRNLHLVSEQDRPDPEFPTVPFPNPEEGGALDLARATADRVGAQVVISNDPDADRFAMSERLPNGVWVQFSGDELGLLLASMILDEFESRGVDIKKCLLVTTAVSSGMMKVMANARGAHVIDTLTGFKWIVNGGMAYANEHGLDFIFGYEESIGYACTPSIVPDKDGVSAAALVLQKLSSVYSQGQTLNDVLNGLFQRYGSVASNNGYVFCHDKASINQLFADFRANGDYLKVSNDMFGEFKVNRIRDVTTGFDNGEPGNRCAMPITPGAHMITLYGDFGRLTLRTSGTEPKIKWYSESCGPDKSSLAERLDSCVDHLIHHVFRPKEFPIENIPQIWTGLHNNVTTTAMTTVMTDTGGSTEGGPLTVYSLDPRAELNLPIGVRMKIALQSGVFSSSNKTIALLSRVWIELEIEDIITISLLLTKARFPDEAYPILAPWFSVREPPSVEALVALIEALALPAPSRSTNRKRGARKPANKQADAPRSAVHSETPAKYQRN